MRTYKTKYSQIALYLLLLIVTFGVMGLTRRCGNSANLPPVGHGDSMGDTLDVAVIYGPLSYYVYDDTLGGLNYDLLRQMEHDTGRPIKLWPVSELSTALSSLRDKKFDMLASLPADTDVKQRFLTTRSVFLDRLVLLQLTDSDNVLKIKNALDLGNDTIFIEKDSPALLRISNLSNEIATPIPVKEVNLSEEYLCMKVAAGEFPLAVVNEKTARKMQLQYPRLSFDNPVSFSQFQVWLLPLQDTLLLRETDKWLDSYIGSEPYNRLIERYTSGVPSLRLQSH